jgi:phospholipid/cholesterol/gamma-HCH transport system substrate-binding protein
MKPFRERNPVPIGAVSLGVIAALIFTAFHAGDMTIFGGGGKKYHAELTDTDDLQSGDSVLVAGVSVGKVTGVDLDGGHVQVTFQLHPGNTIGDQSSASVRLKTLVGDRVLAISSAGSKTLPAGGDIPLDRTSVPLSVQDALGGTSQEVDQINTGQLAQAFNVVSDDLEGAPAVTRQALTGLSRLSTTVANQDTNLQSLLTHAQAVTSTLNSRDSALTEIVKDADLVLQVVQQRKAVIDALLQHSQDLATQITGLVTDNQAALAPALAHLDSVVAVLTKDHDSLDKGIQLLAPFTRDFSNTLGNGHWFDSYIQNIPPSLDIPALLQGVLGSTVSTGGQSTSIGSLLGLAGGVTGASTAAAK